MRAWLRIAVTISAFAVLASMPAAAQGLSDLHAKVREGNRLCMADHFHQGSSAGHSSQKAAEVAAINSWAGFTAWEYGREWGSFRIAGSRGVKCSQAAGGGWGCEVNARPCRLVGKR